MLNKYKIKNNIYLKKKTLFNTHSTFIIKGPTRFIIEIHVCPKKFDIQYGN